jgi:hypothetical protein
MKKREPSVNGRPRPAATLSASESSELLFRITLDRTSPLREDVGVLVKRLRKLGAGYRYSLTEYAEVPLAKRVSEKSLC